MLTNTNRNERHNLELSASARRDQDGTARVALLRTSVVVIE
jgi:hypothetical protein